MRLIAIVWTLGILLRKYAVALLLVVGLGWALIYVNLWGAPPTPQQPPEGYTVQRDRAALQWNNGTRNKPVTLQISVGDPDFEKPIVNKVIKGNGHTMRKLERGATYYWRLIQNGEPGPTASFKVSRYNVDF